MASFYYKNDFMKLKVTEDNHKIIRIDFTDYYHSGETELSQIFRKEMDQYFAGTRREFTQEIYLMPITKIEQASILLNLDMISYGTVINYSQFAALNHKPKAVRYIASLLARNPLPFIFPCHRVILKSGKYGKYRGGTALKARLIELERNFLK